MDNLASQIYSGSVCSKGVMVLSREGIQLFVDNSFLVLWFVSHVTIMVGILS